MQALGSVHCCTPHTRLQLAECPLWDEATQSLMYLDYLDPQICRWHAPSGSLHTHALTLRAPLGGLCLRHNGGYWVANADGLHALSEQLQFTGTIVPPHPSFEAAPPNDMAVGRDGSVWIATADRHERQATGALFCLRSEGWLQIVSDLIIGNGPAFSPDARRLYFADSARATIYVLDDPLQRVPAKPRVFASAEPGGGVPDGLTVDSEGALWSARWGGSCLVRYAADGTENARLALPMPYVTSCAFGDSALSTLFITSARAQGPDTAGDSDPGGRLYRARVPVAGVTWASARA